MENGRLDARVSSFYITRYNWSKRNDPKDVQKFGEGRNEDRRQARRREADPPRRRQPADREGGFVMNNDSRVWRLAYWLITGTFSVMMLFTAYAQLSIPVVAQEISRLGFPAYHFRVELSIAKSLGALALLLPIPSRLKEWAYAGFAIDLVSALIAHLAMGDGPAQFLWPVGFGAAWAFSYILFRKREVGTCSA
jgi:hypothetical protein